MRGLIELSSLVMERKTLRGIRQWAEATGRVNAD
jgi:hypothetical protein